MRCLGSMTRLLAALLLTFVTTACPTPVAGSADPGPQGERGPQGEPGPTGPTGPAGVAGANGLTGPQGPAGAVLVLDGGVVTGPRGAPGASVKLTPLPAGALCPAGGVVVSLEDGGSAQAVCNGVAGPAGAAGAPGASVQVTAFDGGACPSGGVRVVAPDGGVAFVCNGAAGPQGPAGAAGPTGPQGAAGVAGPQGGLGPAGAPGAVLYLDGGALVLPGKVSFAGFSAPSTGNLGGRVGAHALCGTAFPGAHFCTLREFVDATTGAPVPAGGAWLDSVDSADLRTATGASCSGWTSNVANNSSSADIALPTGVVGSSYVTYTDSGCETARPAACCYQAQRVTMRGFTPGTFTGNLGGRSGAHALCAAAYPGSHFCTLREYVDANSGLPTPAPGAWLDSVDAAGLRTATGASCTGWTSNVANNSSSADITLPTGIVGSSYVTYTDSGCQTARKLACCQ